MILTNINLTPKKYAGALAWTGPPALARKLAPAGTPAQPRQPCHFAPLQEKKHQLWLLGGPP